MKQKKQQPILINPAQSIQALAEFNIRVVQLMNIMPEAIDFIRNTATENKSLQEYLVKILEEHTAQIRICTNSYIDQP